MTPYQAAISPTTTRSQCCAVAPTTSARTPAQSHTVASKAPTIRTVRGDSLRGGILAMPNVLGERRVPQRPLNPMARQLLPLDPEFLLSLSKDREIRNLGDRDFTICL